MSRFFLLIDFLLCAGIVAVVLICYERDKDQARQAVQEILDAQEDAKEPAEKDLPVEKKAAENAEPPKEALPEIDLVDPFASPDFDPFAPRKDRQPPPEPADVPKEPVPFADLVTGGEEAPWDPDPEPMRLVILANPPSGPLRTGREAIEKALDEPITVELLNVPLANAVAALRDRCRAKIVLDRDALRLNGYDIVTPVTFQGTRLSLRSSLDQILEPLKLAWTIEDGVLLITTRKKIDSQQKEKAAIPDSPETE